MARKTAICTCPPDGRLWFMGHEPDCPEVAPTPCYAWCFDHGVLHHFVPSEEYRDGVWCRGSWMLMQADEEPEAMEEKRYYYGSAVFLKDLPFSLQVDVLQEQARRDASFNES